MPTQISPDDPNATGAGRLQAMVGGRTPGTPSFAGRPAPGAGRFAFPAPPAPATAPVGKPPDGARKAMAGGAPQPQQPGVAPAPGVAPSPAATPPSAATPPTPGSSQPAPGAGSSQTRGTGAPAAPPPPTVDANGQATQTFASPTIPPAVAPGTTVQTPYGTVSDTPSGQRLTLDPAGQQRYKEKVAALRARFTTPRVMKGMHGLPQMTLKLGESNFDPFSGRFHGKE
jgi:hypothetical protein